VNAPKDWKPFAVRPSDFMEEIADQHKRNITGGTKSFRIVFWLEVRVDYQVVEEADKRVSLKDRIDPAHLLQTIENSFEHSDETSHGVTGVAFPNYSIRVNKRKGLCWLVELTFKSKRYPEPPAKEVPSSDVKHD
jgi:hypothetical protein